MLVIKRYAPRPGDDFKKDKITVHVNENETIDIYLINSGGRQAEIGIDADKKFKIEREDLGMSPEDKKEYDERFQDKKAKIEKKKAIKEFNKKKRRMSGLVGLLH